MSVGGVDQGVDFEIDYTAVVDVYLIVELTIDGETGLTEGVDLIAMRILCPVKNRMVTVISDQRCFLVGIVCWE